MRTCTIENCEDKHYALGWCRGHWRKLSGSSKREYQSSKLNSFRQEYLKEWWKKNHTRYKEQKKEYYKTYYQDNKETITKKIKEWKKAQPIEKKRRWYNRDRDTQQFGGLREEVIKRDGEKCVQCGLTREEQRLKHRVDLSVDHINNLGRNVSRLLKDNRWENLQTLCSSCHTRKSFGHTD